MAGRIKSVWDERVTIHPTISEKLNTALLYLSKDNEMHKYRLIEKILIESPEIMNKIESMEKEGFFQ